jgi:hypothetical protein
MLNGLKRRPPSLRYGAPSGRAPRIDDGEEQLTNRSWLAEVVLLRILLRIGWTNNAQIIA